MSNPKLPAPGTWVAEAAHSSIEATARHLMITKVRGRMQEFDVTVTMTDDPTTTGVTASIKAASISTNDEKRDEHLRSADFLDVENFPEITFHADGAVKSGNDWQLPGTLTIRGVSKTITLDLEYGGLAQDPWGNTRVLVAASTKINREDFDITWNQALETGGMLVSKELDIAIELQLLEKQA